jgi:competence protein ComEA
MSRRKKSPVSVVLVLVVCGFVWVWQNRELLESEHGAGGLPVPQVGGESLAKVGGYTQFPGCRLVDFRNNDGDSFMVRFPDGVEREMRLYFVDAPESAVKDYRDGNSNRKRIGYQGKDLGGMSQGATVAVGQEAKKKTKVVLREGGFTVFTKWQEVFDSGRYFGFVQIGEPGGERWLHELLVEEGLARIYTEGAALPDGTSVRKQKNRLRSLEKRAQSARLGAWGK